MLQHPRQEAKKDIALRWNLQRKSVAVDCRDNPWCKKVVKYLENFRFI